jgi:cell division protein FtsA
LQEKLNKMNNTDEIVVGLDIGTTKIVAMVGRRNEHGKIEILGMGKAKSIGVFRGVVSNIDDTVTSIREAVEEAENKSGVEIKVVSVGIAGQHIKSMQQRGQLLRSNMEDEITQDEIDQLIEKQYNLMVPPGEKIIHVIPQEYIIDNEAGIKKPVGMCGNKLEATFHIITGQVAAIKNLIKCVEKAGLKVSNITLEPIASADSVLSAEEKEAGVVLVDIGGGTTDIAIFHENTIRHTAVIPFGGNVITEDIKQGCSIIKNYAEELKVQHGSALASENQENVVITIPGLRGREPKEISAKRLAQIIEARMEEIIEHIFYEIKNSGFEKKLIAGIVVTGGGAQLKHLPQLIEYITGMDTRIGYPNEHIAKGAEDVTSPMFATGVGLVINDFVTIDKKSNQEVAQEHEEPVTTTRKKDRASIFENLLGKTASWFNEDIN